MAEPPPPTDTAPTNTGDAAADPSKTNVFRPHCSQCPYRIEPDQLSWMARYRHYLHMTMELPTYSLLARMVSITIMTLIFLSTIAFVIETLPELKDFEYFRLLDAIVVVIFTIEYFLRLIACRSPVRFVISFMNIIDLLAVVPFYIELFTNVGGTSILRVFRVVRLVRVFRLFRMSRYSSYMDIMGRALHKSVDAFGLLLFFIFIAVVIFSSLMYFAERGDYDNASDEYLRQDGRVSPFSSVPTTFYWCVITMTTVGYGDVVPLSTAGKLIASVTMISGILIIALPITILGSNFQDVYSIQKNRGGRLRTHSPNGLVLTPYADALLFHRDNIENTLRGVRILLQRRPKQMDFYQVWSAIDYTIITGLIRVEQYLRRLDSSRNV